MLASLLLVTAFLAQQTPGNVPGARFEISFPRSRSAEPLDGRLLVLISNDSTAEPRFQFSDGLGTQLAFGLDVDGLAPGAVAIVDSRVIGYPLERINDIPQGRYRVQAVLNRYETFHRADGHTVKLPPDMGEGQQWNRKPGNLYSFPEWVTLEPDEPLVFRISLDSIIPPIEPPRDTKYIRHERIQSRLLTRFWGRPVYLGAHILLPEGFEQHPNARYPLVIDHGHFPGDFAPWRETPPDPTLSPDSSTRFRLAGYNRIQQEYAYRFYQEWTGPDFPRVLLIQIQHPTPYYDDSYAVNSTNNGPYGDAIMQELLPYIEKNYRGIGQGWARFTYGGSTGGWEAMAVQMFYPDQFNGAWIACPDPVDFRAYELVNIYQDRNAYYPESPWIRLPRVARRDYLGHVSSTVESENRYELVLGTKGRSGGQWDIWQAVYSPVGDDGYPRPIWDKMTGEIDRSVAEYWREHYDLSHILQRDWATLGPKLRGKLHIYVGEADNYYLNDAVYLVEEVLKSRTHPPADAEIDYEPRAEHCWNGDHSRANAYSRLRYAQMFIPRIMDQIRRNSPAGADTTSWRY
jgi:Putative esterase